MDTGRPIIDFTIDFASPSAVRRRHVTRFWGKSTLKIDASETKSIDFNAPKSIDRRWWFSSRGRTYHFRTSYKYVLTPPNQELDIGNEGINMKKVVKPVLLSIVKLFSFENDFLMWCRQTNWIISSNRSTIHLSECLFENFRTNSCSSTWIDFQLKQKYLPVP